MHHIIAYINIFPPVSTNLASHLTLMMTSAQVVEMSVTGYNWQQSESS